MMMQCWRISTNTNPDSRTLAAVEDPELYASIIWAHQEIDDEDDSQTAHACAHAVESINFAHKVAFPNASKGRVAAHFP
jgi:hypothetical protein